MVAALVVMLMTASPSVVDEFESTVVVEAEEAPRFSIKFVTYHGRIPTMRMGQVHWHRFQGTIWDEELKEAYGVDCMYTTHDQISQMTCGLQDAGSVGHRGKNVFMNTNTDMNVVFAEAMLEWSSMIRKAKLIKPRGVK